MAITDITPRGGIAGTAVIVDGSSFGNTEGTITLDGVPVTIVTQWTDVQIRFVTPAGTNTDGAYTLRITRADLGASFEEQFWIPAIDPFNSNLDYQLPNTETGPTQNQDLPRRAEAALFNRLLDIARAASGGSGISVASGPSGDADEVQVSNVTKIRFLTQFLPGEDHYVISRPNGEVFIGGITPPDTLEAKVLTGQPTTFVGRLSDLNNNYKGTDPAGSQVTYITRDVNLTLTTPDGASSWAYASLGNLILSINGFDVANIDLAANFVEVNRPTGQVIANYNTTGTGDPISGGVVSFTGGSLRLLTVQPTSGIDTDDFQRGQAEIVLTGASLQMGYNTIELRHEAAPNVYTAGLIELFWDQDPAGGATDPLATSTTLAEGTPTFNVLSGISYYGAGSTFSMDTSGQRLFNNVYEQNEEPLLVSGVPGIAAAGINIADVTVSGVSVPPQIGELMVVNGYQVIIPAGQQANDVRVTVTPRDPYGSYTADQSGANNFTVMSAVASSTATEEFFQDENYRFPLNTPSFDLVPGALTGNFISATSLLDVSRTNELQVYDHTTGGFKNQLVHPFFNFTSGFRPLGNPDYSALSPGVNFRYVRVFQATLDKSSGILSVPGLTDVDINNALASNVLIDVKVPTKTVWLSLNKPFTLSTFNSGAVIGTGTNGEGCRIDAGVYSPNINGQIRFTLGPFFTGASTNRTLFLRVTYAHSGIPRVLNGSGPGLSLVDW